jgi:hypothetical protein
MIPRKREVPPDQASNTELHEFQPTGTRVYIALAWLWVGVPLAYGFYELLIKVTQLFTKG